MALYTVRRHTLGLGVFATACAAETNGFTVGVGALYQFH